MILTRFDDLPDGVICNIAIFVDGDQASDLWELLELTSELELDLRDTVDWGRKWLLDFNAEKTQLVSFNQSNNAGAIDLKMD